MTQFITFNVDDPQWDDVISKSQSFDFYHTRSYHKLENGNAVLAVAKSGQEFIAMPFVIREIPDQPFFDATSAYGYCGPVGSTAAESDQSLIAFFTQSLEAYFKSNNIIAAFSRLHPLISHAALNDFGNVREVNQTVAVDLRLSAEEQYRQYRKSNKSEINQLRRKGYEVFQAQDESDIRAFWEIYNETMSRVEASANYFFPLEYFRSFLNAGDFKSRLLLARIDGKVAAGAIFTYTGSIIQYHLAGTTAEFIRDTPMKLILDEARRTAPENFEFLHLGGGVGGSDSDSLFRFKSGFSDYRCLFKTWQFIADNDKYQELVASRNPDRESKFFPLYRAPSLNDV